MKLLPFPAGFVAIVLAATVDAQQTETRAERSPILVTFDLHMDPMSGARGRDRKNQLYREWCDAAEWLLDVTAKRGAKLSFTTVGEFAEVCLEDPEGSFPLIRRLYESGGSVGTHSHSSVREAPFRWVNAGFGASSDSAEQVWVDDMGLVDRLVAEAFELQDPARIRAINNLRGAHVPGDASERHALFRKYGLSIAQAGPGEDFVGLFHHYLFHPFRASADNEMSEDRASPMILTQAGPVLGQVGVHKGVEQDMSLARIQTQFLLEVLAWLNDAGKDAPDRVWCFGWAVHGSDVTPRGVSRKWVEPTLDWFARYFVGKTIGGRTIARWGSYKEEADAYLAWEKAKPALASRDYDGRVRDWSAYPWPVVAGAAYLWDATYVEAVPSDETVQVHRLQACRELGGPYPIVVAFPTGAAKTKLDLGAIEAGSWTRIDPATGPGDPGSAGESEVPATGAIFVPTRACVPLQEQQKRIDAGFPRDLPRFGPGGGKGRGRAGSDQLDRDGDGKISRDEFPGGEQIFRRLDENGDGVLDEDELEQGRPR